MTNFKLRGVLAAVAGTLVLGVATSATADATFDLVDALVKKGVLTEEEALPLLKGRENDIQAADKKVKKTAKLQISDVLDSAKVYGDIRVRGEYRKGTAGAASEERERGRYKITLGVTTETKDFYTDLAFAMGPGGRSDNSTFGNGNATAANQQNGTNNKETLYVKRAMIGWKATDWLTLEAGRMANPLFTTEMVWDKDLTFEGVAEKLTYTVGSAELFGNFVQSQYIGDYKGFYPNSAGTDRYTNNLLAFQGGVRFPVTDMISAKAAITYTTYSNNKSSGTAAQNIFVPTTTGTGIVATNNGTNDLRTIEVPVEVDFKTAGDLSYKLFGDFVYNTSGEDRYNNAIANATGSTGGVLNSTLLRNAGNDDTAWLLGAGVKSAAGKAPTQGDWEARVWYQDVGVYSVDQNAVDSDFMDSRVNMKGIVLKAQYNARDNVFVNFAAGQATLKNHGLTAVGTASDIGLNLNNYQLYQLDLTYKF